MLKNVIEFELPIYCEPVLKEYFNRHYIDCNVAQKKKYPYKTTIFFKSEDDMIVFILRGTRLLIDPGKFIIYSEQETQQDISKRLLQMY